METKRNTFKWIINCTQKEKGITLVALIITIIILVILSAVSISAVYKSKIIDYAIDGAQKYAAEGVNENKVMEGTEQLIESAVSTIKEMGITGGPIPTPDPGPAEDELIPTEALGKYVDYKSAGSDYIVDKTYSGADENQTFSANNSMKWRIWGVEGNKLLLISETLVGRVQLKAAESYNNIVKLLNDGCSTAFGNSIAYGSGVIKARSINQEDIDKVTNMTTDEQRKAVNSNYGTTISPNDYNWPNIYGEEPSKTGGGSLGRSNQTQWYTGTTNTSFTGKVTTYNYSIASYATHTLYDALLTNPVASSTSGSKSHSDYWVASRGVGSYTTYARFCLYSVYKGEVISSVLYTSNGGNEGSNTCAVRPMIEVNLDAVTIGATGDGTATNPYSMAKK